MNNTLIQSKLYNYRLWNGSGFSCYTPVSLKLFVSQIAVSLEETFSGPNGFNNTDNSWNRFCCIRFALNSSNPSRASALCWYDEVSNLCCWEPDSEDGRLEMQVVGLFSEHSLLVMGATLSTLVMYDLVTVLRLLSKLWTVHLSFVIDLLSKLGEV